MCPRRSAPCSRRSASASEPSFRTPSRSQATAIPAFRVEGKVVIGFKANKSDYSIYPFSGGAAERFPEELKGRTVTSGSIHFTPEDPISDDLLRRIIEWRIQANRERGGR